MPVYVVADFNSAHLRMSRGEGVIRREKGRVFAASTLGLLDVHHLVAAFREILRNQPAVALLGGFLGAQQAERFRDFRQSLCQQVSGTGQELPVSLLPVVSVDEDVPKFDE